MSEFSLAGITRTQLLSAKKSKRFDDAHANLVKKIFKNIPQTDLQERVQKWKHEKNGLSYPNDATFSSIHIFEKSQILFGQ